MLNPSSSTAAAIPELKTVKVGAGRARRGAILGTVPNSDGSVGHPGTILTNQRAPGRGREVPWAAVTRNLLKLKPHVGPTRSCLLELAPTRCQDYCPDCYSKSQRSRFTHCSSSLLHPGLGSVARHSSHLAYGRISWPYQAACCCSVLPSACAVTQATWKDIPGQAGQAGLFQFSTCSSRRRQEAKQEQVGQTCSNEDISKISVL